MEEIGKGNAQIDWQLSKSKGGIRFESIDYKFFLCTRYSWWSRIQCEKTCRRITDQRTDEEKKKVIGIVFYAREILTKKK